MDELQASAKCADFLHGHFSENLPRKNAKVRFQTPISKIKLVLEPRPTKTAIWMEHLKMVSFRIRHGAGLKASQYYFRVKGNEPIPGNQSGISTAWHRSFHFFSNDERHAKKCPLCFLFSPLEKVQRASGSLTTTFDKTVSPAQLKNFE